MEQSFYFIVGARIAGNDILLYFLDNTGEALTKCLCNHHFIKMIEVNKEIDNNKIFFPKNDPWPEWFKKECLTHTMTFKDV